MTIKSVYTTAEEVPENVKDLYEEKDGQFFLTKVEGMKTDADVARVTTALNNERKAHSTLKTTFNTFLGERKLEDIQADLDRIPELETLANGKIDETKLNELAEGRIKTKLAPLERDLNLAKTALQERDAKIAEFEAKERRRTIHDGVRGVATKSKIIDTAMDDVLMLAEVALEVGEDGKTILVKEDNPFGITPGLTPEQWLVEMQTKRPHWWPASVGGGAHAGGGGSFGDNPFTNEGWNMTEQAKIVNSNRPRAEAMAKAAGTTIGGMRPAPKK